MASEIDILNRAQGADEQEREKKNRELRDLEIEMKRLSSDIETLKRDLKEKESKLERAQQGANQINSDMVAIDRRIQRRLKDIDDFQKEQRKKAA